MVGVFLLAVTNSQFQRAARVGRGDGLIVLAKNHEHDAFVGDHRFDSAVANGLHSATVRASCLSGVAVASVVVCRVVVWCGGVLGGCERRNRQ